MIDFADLVVVNKFERPGGADALRDVRKQYRRSRNLFDPKARDEDLPVFGTISSQFNDPGVTAAYQELLAVVRKKCGVEWKSSLPRAAEPRLDRRAAG